MTATTNVYPRVRRAFGALALATLVGACEQPTEPGRTPDAPAGPLKAEVAASLSLIVDDVRGRVLPDFQDAATRSGLEGPLTELHRAFEARSISDAALARGRLELALRNAAQGPEGTANDADLDVVRLLLIQMDGVVPTDAPR